MPSLPRGEPPLRGHGEALLCLGDQLGQDVHDGERGVRAQLGHGRPMGSTTRECPIEVGSAWHAPTT